MTKDGLQNGREVHPVPVDAFGLPRKAPAGAGDFEPVGGASQRGPASQRQANFFAVFFLATFLVVFFLAVFVDFVDLAVLVAFVAFLVSATGAAAGAAMGAGAAAVVAVGAGVAGAVAGVCAKALAAIRPVTRTARSFFICAVSIVNRGCGPHENPCGSTGNDSSDRWVDRVLPAIFSH